MRLWKPRRNGDNSNFVLGGSKMNLKSGWIKDSGNIRKSFSRPIRRKCDLTLYLHLNFLALRSIGKKYWLGLFGKLVQVHKWINQNNWIIIQNLHDPCLTSAFLLTSLVLIFF